MKRLSLLIAALAVPLLASAEAPNSLLNVSYDVSRGFYQAYNPVFVKHYEAETGQKVTINQSHGGSGKQARAVVEGLEADVVTMNSGLDIDIIATQAKGKVAADWRSAFPHGAAPSWSTTLFIVRKGNPKGIKDWPDLTRKGVSVVIPNPKTSGNGRYSYLAAWLYGLSQPNGSEATAKAFVGKLFNNVPILDGGGRGATTSFAQRAVGDVLLTFESEVKLILQEFGEDKFEVVVPSVSIRAANPVVVVEDVTAKRGTAELAKAYLGYLYSDAGQDLYVKSHLRPSVPSAWERHKGKFADLKTLDAEKALGATWLEIFEAHFKDGGHFDQLAINQ
ncbi:MAG: sulfate ABC transporter substrate-binding protein [Polycyclovorans sp.]